MSTELFLKRLQPEFRLVTAAYTRPANTTTYAAGDVLADATSGAVILTLPNMARAAGGGGIVIGATLIDSSVQSLKPDIDLHLFDTSITMQNDNEAWAASDADRLREIGVLSFRGGDFKAGTLNGSIQAWPLGVPYVCASGSTTLYGVAVVRNAYIPTSAEVFTFNLLISRGG